MPLNIGLEFPGERLSAQRVEDLIPVASTDFQSFIFQRTADVLAARNGMHDLDRSALVRALELMADHEVAKA